MISAKFLFAGKAIFTVKNPDGDYYTFKVVKSKVMGFNGEYLFFISILTSPDTYTYIGLVNWLGVTLTKKSKYTKDTLPFKVAKWAVLAVSSNKGLPDGYEIYHVGKCGSCGRDLTTPISIELGLGPICVKRI